MYDLPTTVEVDGKSYAIRNKGDFRMVLDCFSALNDTELEEQYRVLTSVLIFFDDFNSLEDIPTGNVLTELISGMFKFFNLGDDTSSPGLSTQEKLIDWEDDEQLIMSAVNNVSGKELRLESYVHWWTFLGYYQAIGECPLSNIISIRHKIKTGKKLEKYEQEFRRNNPNYFISKRDREIQKENNELLASIWNK